MPLLLLLLLLLLLICITITQRVTATDLYHMLQM
jgi:hypothetical protein